MRLTLGTRAILSPVPRTTPQRRLARLNEIDAAREAAADRAEAAICTRDGVSRDEVATDRARYRRHGLDGLKTTKLQEIRAQ
jgi:hypothetical protein